MFDILICLIQFLPVGMLISIPCLRHYISTGYIDSRVILVMLLVFFFYLIKISIKSLLNNSIVDLELLLLLWLLSYNCNEKDHTIRIICMYDNPYSCITLTL